LQQRRNVYIAAAKKRKEYIKKRKKERKERKEKKAFNCI
jgi:hypothetical protein